MDCKNKAVLEKVLKDCGCTQKVINECLMINAGSSEEKLLPFLQQQRYRLLQKIHEEQQKLDILDYVIFKIKQGGLKNV